MNLQTGVWPTTQGNQKMLKLTQLTMRKDELPVLVAVRHIVAVYPDQNGIGCHIELTTNTDPDAQVMHVKESAEHILREYALCGA